MELETSYPATVEKLVSVNMRDAIKEREKLVEDISNTWKRVGDYIETAPPDINLYKLVKSLKDTSDLTRKVQRTRETVSEGVDSPPQDADSEVSERFLFLGLEIPLVTALEKQKRLLDQGNYPDFIHRLVTMQKLADIGVFSVSVGGVALRDFIDSKRQIPPKNLLRFFGESWSLFLKPFVDESHVMNFDQLMKENQDVPMDEYPSLSKSVFVLAGIRINDAVFHETIDMSSFMKKGKSFKDAVDLTQKFLKNIDNHRLGLFNILMNPENSPDFEEVQPVMQEYLDDEISQTHILRAAKLLDPDKFIYVYRRSEQLAQAGVHPEFYSALADHIKIYTLTNYEYDYDLETIFDFDSVPVSESEQTLPDWDRLKKLVQEIFQNTSNKIYSVDPKGIPWNCFIEPQSVTVAFDENRPQKFILQIRWENPETGESSRTSLLYSTKENAFDWSFLEDPNNLEFDPYLPDVKASCMAIVQPILKDVKAQAEEIKRKKLESRGRQGERDLSSENGVTATKEHVRDIVYDLRKEEKARLRSETPSQIPSSILDSPDFPEKLLPKAKNTIFIEDNAVFETQLAEVPQDFQENVRRAIEKYNRDGLGELKKLTVAVGKDGEPLYALRVSRQSGSIRVLLVKDESLNNGNTFRIVRIGMRKDIYKKKGKGTLKV